MTAISAERIRDADRSREQILESAERLFAERGYEAASLADIAADAGLSRGTPSYFFGSKEQLYREILDRAFIARQEATSAALKPVMAWCDGGAGLPELREALLQAANDYLRFLSTHPNFVRLVMQEELSGGKRMQQRKVSSTAMQDAFAAVRRVGADRGLRSFDVREAILVFVALTFTPIALRNTLMRAVSRDLTKAASRRQQAELAVDQLMHLMTA
jgi:TetR/AcrR family transcriptional regulator